MGSQCQEHLVKEADYSLSEQCQGQKARDKEPPKSIQRIYALQKYIAWTRVGRRKPYRRGCAWAFRGVGGVRGGGGRGRGV
jgi:hypothetical protein